MPYSDPTRQRLYQREWIARRRKEYFSDKSCRTCDSTTDLELHHRERHGKVDHRIWSWSESRRMAEIAKCDVLCTKCHDVADWVDSAPPHGTHSRYSTAKWRCRCSLCRAAHAATNRRYKR